MRKIVLACIAALLSSTLTHAQKSEVTYKSKQPYKSWVKMAPKLNDDFFKTKEAIRIGDNVLLYQQTTGGWPKNIYIPAELDEKEREEVLSEKTMSIKARLTIQLLQLKLPICLASITPQASRSTRKPPLKVSDTYSKHNTITVDGPNFIHVLQATTPTSPTTTMP